MAWLGWAWFGFGSRGGLRQVSPRAHVDVKRERELRGASFQRFQGEVVSGCKNVSRALVCWLVTNWRITECGDGWARSKAFEKHVCSG